MHLPKDPLNQVWWNVGEVLIWDEITVFWSSNHNLIGHVTRMLSIQLGSGELNTGWSVVRIMTMWLDLKSYHIDSPEVWYLREAALFINGYHTLCYQQASSYQPEMCWMDVKPKSSELSCSRTFHSESREQVANIFHFIFLTISHDIQHLVDTCIIN